ncbi:putative RING-type E3 ubiquitin transferase C3H69 [Apium graveolens]|uniref:putative RING-type E3 ubiquitin transferase C3H69 n=1 Tax=Apium graveolens TaxID=4045 RepID=UPI003D7A228F
MSKSKVLCKFFSHGACLKGESCEFSHDWKDPANNACTFYQKGACSYGSRCRYEHVKVSRSEACAPSSSAVTLQSSGSFTAAHSSRNAASGVTPVVDVNGDLLASSRSFLAATEPERNDISALPNSLYDSYTQEFGNTNSSELSMCSFAAAGSCPRGDTCSHIHGDLCPTCGKHCLHPYRPEERADHVKMCEKKQNQIEALKHSQEIECCVCLERVLSKPTPAERKFGLLSECDHAFCVSCIRNWRSSSPTSGMDVNSALRACPICRKLSYFVIPSVIWYSSKEEKKEIVDSYKSKLRSIHCRHFDFGDGSCPFGTSCFYKHAYRDGRLEEVDLRHLGAEDGNTVIAKDIRLSDFLNSLRLR